jgi:hypothetical protein
MSRNDIWGEVKPGFSFHLARSDTPELQEWKRKHPQCIGCGKFLRKDSNWNQCSDCDTREPGEY